MSQDRPANSLQSLNKILLRSVSTLSHTFSLHIFRIHRTEQSSLFILSSSPSIHSVLTAFSRLSHCIIFHVKRIPTEKKHQRLTQNRQPFHLTNWTDGFTRNKLYIFIPTCHLPLVSPLPHTCVGHFEYLLHFYRRCWCAPKWARIFWLYLIGSTNILPKSTSPIHVELTPSANKIKMRKEIKSHKFERTRTENIERNVTIYAHFLRAVEPIRIFFLTAFLLVMKSVRRIYLLYDLRDMQHR